MKLPSLPLLLLCFIFISCKQTKIPNEVFKPSNLKSTFISLSADSAYTLRTAKGAVIRISERSFAATGKVRLEVKEAYSLQDMLMAGLTTENDGKLLNSGGMIYINATENNNQVKLLKAISFALPGQSYDDKMQLFKGEWNDDSSINWVDPKPLDSSAFQKRLVLGERLFKANCASCHKTLLDFTGPKLAYCRDREPDRDWAYRFTTNPSLMFDKDPYATAIRKKWNNVTMTAFPFLDRDKVNAILDYCDNYADKQKTEQTQPAASTAPINSPTDTSISGEPCFVNDTSYNYPENNTSIQVVPNDSSMTPAYQPNQLSEPETAEGLRGGFSDPVQSGVYEFSISTFGWYNVDAFVKGYAGSTYVNVTVSLRMQYEADMHVYLFCPDRKMLSVGIQQEIGTYIFDKVNGRIPLFLNDKAVLFAFGSKKDQYFYGTATFNVQTAQTSVIQVKETSLKELRSFAELNKIDGINIDAKRNEFVYKETPLLKDTVVVEMEVQKIPCSKSDSLRPKMK